MDIKLTKISDADMEIVKIIWKKDNQITKATILEELHNG